MYNNCYSLARVWAACDLNIRFPFGSFTLTGR